MKQSARLSNVPPYHFARWAERINAARESGLDVIRLDMGNPDMPPPAEVIEELCRSAHRPDHHGYPGFRGIPPLREAIAAYYVRRFGVTLDPESQIITLIGSKEGIVNLAIACLDPGDIALIPDPCYAPYTMGTLLAGGEVVTVPLRKENGFLPDLERIPADIADRAVLMWLNYPNNPTGATADLEFLSKAVHFARHHDMLLCHDAPYCDVTYNGFVAPSIMQVPGAAEVAVEFNSFSKTFNMAGWRMGLAVGNADALEALASVKSNMGSGIFRPLQEAAVQALSVSREWIDSRNEIYRERLQLISEGLKMIGIDAALPRATLYIWAEVPPGKSSEEFAISLLDETGISVTPGSFFGPAGEGYIRVSATAETERIREACRRLQNLSKEWLSTVRGS
jgi:LL-diaminopimelate aminotransferase